MKRTQIAGITLILVLMLVAACTPADHTPRPTPVAPGPTPMVAPAPAAAPAPQVPTKAAWEVEWEMTMEAARKEGRVIVYSGAGSEARVALSKAFGAKYGIAVEMIGGRGAELSRKIMTERRAGIYAADVWLSGAEHPLTVLKPAGALEPMEPRLILPEVNNAKLWWGGGLTWIEKEHMELATLTDIKETIGINTRLVKLEEIKSFRDLLDPRWKGRIVMGDTSAVGSAGTWFAGMMQMGALDDAYMRKLAAQQPVIVADERLQVDWLAHGKYPVLVAPHSGSFADVLNAGAPVARLMPAEGTYVTTSNAALSLLNRPAHPNTANVFLNWILSKEGQTVLSKGLLIQSRRLDVPTDFLPPERVRQPGLNYWDFTLEERIARQEGLRKVAKEIFPPK